MSCCRYISHHPVHNNSVGSTFPHREDNLGYYVAVRSLSFEEIGYPSKIIFQVFHDGIAASEPNYGLAYREKGSMKIYREEQQTPCVLTLFPKELSQEKTVRYVILPDLAEIERNYSYLGLR